jgi:CRISPR-associated protein Cmr4
MRSVKGVFAWTTSPYLLDRLRWDMQEVGCKSWGKTPVVEGTDCLLAQPTALLHEGKVYLDDLDFTARKDMEGTQKVATTLGTLFFPGETDRADFLTQHLCIVPDDVMTLLLETGTELQTHVCLDSDTKTVKSGQLWQEESLPVESLLVALVQVNPEQNSGASKDPTGSQKELDMHLRNLCTREGRKATLQFGGKSTVGKGLCQVGLVGKE